jgi:hypothetical protein
MKWKLWIRDDGARPPVVSSQLHDSKHAALEAACWLIRRPIKQLQVKILYIEEPDGNRIGLEEILASCKG